MDRLARHLRPAFAELTRQPRVSLTAVVTIGLAIGATTALVSVVEAVLMAPLPYKDPDRLVMIWKGPTRGETTWLSLREVVEYGRTSKTLAQIGAYSDLQASFTEGDRPERVTAALVTPGLVASLGVAAQLGRSLEDADGAPGAEPVVLIGGGLWARRFGSDPLVVGGTTIVNDLPRRIVGVMPPGFRLPRDFASDRPTEAWVPATVDRADLGAWGNRSFVAVARLRDNATSGQATSELHLIADQWMQAGYVRDSGDGALHRDAMPVTTFVTGEVRQPLLLLLGAVGAVLLIACANVANLLLARADLRRREMATRAALGASRTDLIGQLLIESLMLAVAGGALGVALAFGAERVLTSVSAASLPRAGSIAVNLNVLLVSAGVTLLSGLVFGLLPAWRVSKTDVRALLNDGGRSGTVSAERHAFRRMLVVAELAGSVVLLVGAGLLIRSLVELSRVELGFDTRGVLTAQVQPPASDYPQPADVVRFYRELTSRLAGLPGVEAAGAVRVLPLARTIGDWSITIEGRPTQPNENPNADYQAVTPGYFTALRLPLVSGRYLSDQDREGMPVVAVINDVMAARYWPDQDALGKRFHMGTADQPWATVVGIVRQVRHNAVVETPRAEMYLAHAQLPDEIRSTPRAMTLTIRTAGEPLAMVEPLRETVRGLDSRLPVSDVRALDAVASAALAGPRFTTRVLAGFALLALLIASVGIYGTIALLVGERAQEIGIRLALGAAPRSVFRMVVNQGLGLALAGITLGLGAAAVLARTLESLVYGIRPLDPVTFVIVPAVMGVVTLLACAGPARKAARVDPVATLRR